MMAVRWAVIGLQRTGKDEEEELVDSGRASTAEREQVARTDIIQANG